MAISPKRYLIWTKYIRLAIKIFFIVLFCLCLTDNCGCTKKKPLKIGMAVCLSGRLADLGFSGRNGALLAIEQQNARGGINGREIVFSIKDDKSTPETARRAVLELINQGVTAIIGHMTSNMSMETVPLINTYETVMISPTTSTYELSGKDDYFFRVYPDISTIAGTLAQLTAERLHLMNAAVIYDESNLAFTENAYNAFRKEYEQLGGKIVDTRKFRSSPTFSFHEMVHDIVEKNAECIVVYASAIDTANLCQQVQKINPGIQVLCSDWSATEELLQFGGNAVEGTILIHSIQHNNKTPKFIRFRQDYYDRFGTYPDFAACHAYDTTCLLIEALRINDDPTVLKQTLYTIKNFEGLQATIEFDEYGDVIRDLYPVRITNNQFNYLDKNAQPYQSKK